MKLWVIDDDSIYQMLTKRMVEKSHPDIQVVSFLNGKLAFDALSDAMQSGSQDELPSVVFLDINMPVMNGWEFLDAMIQRGFHSQLSARIYIVSSSIDKSDFEKAKTYDNVSDYLVKPLSKSDFEKYLIA
ncbi:MAG: two component signal transductions system response regulator [Bacteroidetes bacterium HLUCCA01]|nr:MAG: two component signal transductions system response regulator [Bacteroidetes bacterium HLUCCA01]